MTKRTNRVAWGVAAVLAVVLVGGLSALANSVQRTHKFTVEWQPISAWDCWWVGTESIPAAGPRGSVEMTVGESYSLGFVEVDVWDAPLDAGGNANQHK